MQWDIILTLCEIACLVIVIGTSFMIGLSLVEVNVVSLLWKLTFISIISGLLLHFLAIFVHYNIVFLMIYISLIPVTIYFFKVPFYQSCLATLLAIIYHLAIVKLLIYNLFDIALLNTNMTEDPVIQVALAIFTLLTNVFIALLVYRSLPVLFPRRWLNSESHEMDTERHKFHIIFIILILLLLTVFLFYTYTELLYFRPSYRVFIMFWCLLTCILMVYFSRNIVIYSLERVQFTIDRSYQKDMLKFYNLIRSQRHDFNIHLNAIYGLIQNKNYTESHTYIEEIIGEAKDINDLLPLYHPATAALLSTLKLDALQKGVRLTFNLQDNLKSMPCTIYETNKILGNLIYNAIEEVEQNNLQTDPVNIEISKAYHSIILKVSNKTTVSEDQLQQIFNVGFSTKHAHEGIGLPTINTIISNYNGVLYPQIDNDWITMTVRIPLSTP